MQGPASATMEAILELHDYISFFLVVIFIFVMWFFFNILVDFKETTANHTPASIALKEISYKFSSRIVHRGTLEVIWTIIPVLILSAIAVPSFQLLYALDVIIFPLFTIKCIGNQWYWSYEGHYLHNIDVATQLNDQLNAVRDKKETLEHAMPAIKKLTERVGENMLAFYTNLEGNPTLTVKEKGQIISRVYKMIDSPYATNLFNIAETRKAPQSLDVPKIAQISGDSYMLDADELALGAYRVLETDTFPILPLDSEFRFIITSMDVLHSFAVPALGIKLDAIPGRLNQFGMRVRTPGTYFGQCSELCGVGHGFMPIKLQFMDFSVYAK